MRIHRTPVGVAALLLVGAAGVTTGAVMASGGGSCTDPATGHAVVPGDGIVNGGTEYVCSNGMLVSYVSYGQQTPAGRVVPRGFHWQWANPVSDCGPLRKQKGTHRPVIVWRGSGFKQTALFCPGKPYGNGTIWPS